LQVNFSFLMHTREIIVPPAPISGEALMGSAVRRPISFGVSWYTMQDPPTWFDVPQADPGFLYGESKGERDFGAIVDLDFPNGKGSVCRTVAKKSRLAP
jgi:hypothetical protein